MQRDVLPLLDGSVAISQCGSAALANLHREPPAEHPASSRGRSTPAAVSWAQRRDAAAVQAGDGDCGETVKRGSESVLTLLDTLAYGDLGATSKRLAVTVGESMGGTSGALYQIFFTAAAVTLKGVAAEAAGVEDWAAALQSGVEAVRRYGLAGVGDRTMVDALVPAMDAVNTAVEAGAAVLDTPGLRRGFVRVHKLSTCAKGAVCPLDVGSSQLFLCLSAQAWMVRHSMARRAACTCSCRACPCLYVARGCTKRCGLCQRWPCDIWRQSAVGVACAEVGRNIGGGD